MRTLIAGLRRPNGLGLALLLGLSLVAQGAHAARLATVVHGVGAGSDRAAALVGHSVRQGLGADERYEVVDVNKALGNQDRDKALRAFAQAEELVQKGREAYDTLELDAAVNELNQALSKYERFPAYVADFRKVAETLMLLGATHILRGEDKLGVRRLEQALSILPTIEPDPRIFNPSMRTLFAETATRARGRATGTLSLSSTPSAAEIYVDGRFAGVTPLRLDKLSEGRHWVRLERDGQRAWGKVYDLVGRSEATDSAQLRPTTHLDGYDAAVNAALGRMGTTSDGGGSNDAIDALGLLLSVDQILLAQVRLDGEKVQVQANQYDVNAQRLLRSRLHSFAYDSRNEVYERESAVLLRTYFGSDLPQAQLAHAAHGGRHAKGSKEALAHDGAEADAAAAADGPMHAGQARCLFGLGCHTLKVTVGGVAIGVGGLGMAAGGVYWYLARHDYNSMRKLTQVSPLASELANGGHAKALRGDIIFGAGALVAAAGIATLIWWTPTPSDAAVLESGGTSSPPQTTLEVLPLLGGGWASATVAF